LSQYKGPYHRLVEEIRAIKDEFIEEDDENDVLTLATSDVGELLLIKGLSVLAISSWQQLKAVRSG